jgi:type I restriction enzyme S subunit
LGFNACVPDSIVGLFPYKGVEPEFLYYQLSCLQSWLYALAPENTQMNLNIDRFSPQKIAIPPQDEQKEICRFIVQIERQVETALSGYTRQLALLLEHRAALIHEYVTGQRVVV